MDVGETPAEQSKQPEQGTREAALWLAQMADRAMKGAHADLAAAVAADPVNALWMSAGAQSYLTGAQVHALIYIGDQVKALVEAIGPAAEAVAHPPCLLVDLAKVEQSRGFPVRHVVRELDALDFPPTMVARRRGQRGEGKLHPVGCRCDDLCRALGREAGEPTARVAGALAAPSDRMPQPQIQYTLALPPHDFIDRFKARQDGLHESPCWCDAVCSAITEASR